MTILGIDPGIARLGFGLVVKKAGRVNSLLYGCMETSKDEDEEQRLRILFEKTSRLIKKYKPEAVVLEKIFFSQNVKTALTVGQARGIVMLSGAMFNLPIFSYTPLEVKLAITGYGRADKKQIQKMIQSILNLKKLPQPDDAADALGIAVTHCFTHKL